MTNDDAWGTVFLVGVIAVVLAVLGLGGWSTYKSIASNGETDYCYVEMWSPGQMAPQFQLYGHRPWRFDRMLGVYPNVEEAKLKADVLGCSTRVRP